MSHQMHTEHPHSHSATCGHAAVTHDGHTDYLHDGHVHHEHAGHWDECGTDQHVTAESHAAHGDHYDER
ncbi:hypothetical protein [Micromonospora sp. LOL_021]|uniref:hypothetical protein n=1 Tax=Micromonospora sp. LOL_021 TaxID=3345417 RepID=UPI003A886AB5